MKKIQLDEFLALLDYKPKYIGKELVDPVRFVEFRSANCYAPSMEFSSSIDSKKGGQPFYFEIIDFRNYDMTKGIIISDSRRHNVIHEYLNRKNIEEIANRVNSALKNTYCRKGPIW